MYDAPLSLTKKMEKRIVNYRRTAYHRYASVIAETCPSPLSLLKNQESGADIPFMEIHFPIAFEKSGCDVTDISSGRTETTYIPNARKYPCKIVHVVIGIGILVNREAG